MLVSLDPTVASGCLGSINPLMVCLPEERLPVKLLVWRWRNSDLPPKATLRSKIKNQVFNRTITKALQLATPYLLLSDDGQNRNKFSKNKRIFLKHCQSHLVKPHSCSSDKAVEFCSVQRMRFCSSKMCRSSHFFN